MSSHEVDGLGCNYLGGHREVALVLAIVVVDDHNHAPRSEFFNGRLNRSKDRRFVARAKFVHGVEAAGILKQVSKHRARFHTSERVCPILSFLVRRYVIA